MTGLAPLYRHVDELLELRARTYPRRVEPLFGELQAAIGELASTLRATAGTVAPEAPAFAATPAFVVGYYRSGTTLMLNLLQGHPEVVALPGESKHFSALRNVLAALPEERRVAELHAAWIRRLVSPDGLPPFWALGRPWEGGADLYAVFTRRLLAYAATREPAQDLLGVVAAALAATLGAEPRLWVEKTPRDELLVPVIVAAYPAARFVHMVRDPRATLASIEGFHREQYLASVPVAAAELRGSLEAARANAEQLGADRYLVVRYEDLVADPEREMRRVSSFLDLSWSDALVTPSSTANSSTAGRRVEGRIHRLSAGGGTELGRVSDAVVRAFAAEPARALGYDVPRGSAAVAAATRAYLSAAFRSRRAFDRLRPRAPQRSPSS